MYTILDNLQGGGCPVKNRLDHIREQVKNEKKVTVSELSKIYKVTEETIRRDLEKLEKEGFLTRTFGGAVLNSAVRRNISIFISEHRSIKRKKLRSRNSLRKY